jgi:hypothetical protein
MNAAVLFFDKIRREDSVEHHRELMEII